MSRSYRYAVAVCGYGGVWKRFMKNQANKFIRHTYLLDIPTGAKYKKIGINQYDICDYKSNIEKSDEHYYKYRRK